MREPIAKLSIRLHGISPPVWRRVDVPLSMTLKTLHETIQGCFGWASNHLYKFDVGDAHYGEPHPDYAPEHQLLRADAKRLSALVKAGHRRLRYVYDFGDYWEHDLTIEKLTTGDAETRYPAYIDGTGRTPPEDVGGPGGYASFLERIENPNDAEHDETIEWLKTTKQEQRWLRNAFDDEEARAAVSAIAQRRWPTPKALDEPEPPAGTPADGPKTLHEKLTDQAWLDNATPEEETGALIDVLEMLTSNEEIRPATIGHLASYGIEISRRPDRAALLGHIGPSSYGTLIVRLPDENGRLEITTGLTDTDETWVEDRTARARLVEAMKKIADEPAWTDANSMQLNLTEIRRGAQQLAEIQWALEQAVQEWTAAPMAASTIDRLLSRLETADTVLHIEMGKDDGGPLAIHITSKRSLKPPTSGLFVLGPNPDDNGVLLSSEGTRFNIKIAWHRGERDGRLGTTGDAGICSALNREQHRGTEPTPWDWNDWRSTLQKIADMPSLWILAKQEADEWLAEEEPDET